MYLFMNKSQNRLFRDKLIYFMAGKATEYTEYKRCKD